MTKKDIDAMVLDSGGNLFDSLCLATLAALHDTKIPSIKVDNIHGDAEEGNIARGILSLFPCPSSPSSYAMRLLYNFLMTADRNTDRSE